MNPFKIFNTHTHFFQILRNALTQSLLDLINLSYIFNLIVMFQKCVFCDLFANIAHH